jgi:molybdate transport system substrate-binding protein
MRRSFFNKRLLALSSFSWSSLALKTRFLFALTLASFVSLALVPSIAQAQQKLPLRIATAANFSPVLKTLIVEFTEQTQIPTQIISSATGALYQQIKHGAPFDVFLSADHVRPQKLADDKLTIAGSLQPYAYGQLALWSAKPSINLSLAFFHDDLGAKSLSKNRFAIANPDIAPYGKAAKQVLTSLNAWKNYQKKLIIGININQTFQQIRSQAVNAGIVAYSQLVINKLEGFLIPKDYYQPIKQSMVILKSSKQQANAKIFSQYLLSEKTQRRIKAFGYQSIVQHQPDTQTGNDNKGSAL